MADKLLSLGLDVGTTTSQLIVSELMVENRGSAFTVPELTITSRNILYRSPVIFTPLLGENRVDGEALKSWVTSQFLSAGIDRSQVDTGAVIITGETSRKENARSVLEALSGFAGEFVVTTAGPHLESVLAAKGSGAVAFSEETGQTVLNMDIGGGTTNLALVRKGKILRTGCLNVGGRLIRYDPQGTPTYVSPALPGVTEDTDPRRVSSLLAQALEMAAGLTPATGLLTSLSTREAGAFWEPPQPGAVICFSGGVADCTDRSPAPLEHGEGNPQKPSVSGGIPNRYGNHPCHRHRRRLSQHPAIRQHSLCPKRNPAPSGFTGGILLRRRAGFSFPSPSDKKQKAGFGRHSGTELPGVLRCVLPAGDRIGGCFGGNRRGTAPLPDFTAGYGKGSGAGTESAAAGRSGDFMSGSAETGNRQLSGCGQTGGGCVSGGHQNSGAGNVTR